MRFVCLISVLLVLGGRVAYAQDNQEVNGSARMDEQKAVDGVTHQEIVQSPDQKPVADTTSQPAVPDQPEKPGTTTWRGKLFIYVSNNDGARNEVTVTPISQPHSRPWVIYHGGALSRRGVASIIHTMEPKLKKVFVTQVEFKTFRKGVIARFEANERWNQGQDTKLADHGDRIKKLEDKAGISAPETSGASTSPNTGQSSTPSSGGLTIDPSTGSLVGGTFNPPDANSAGADKKTAEENTSQKGASPDEVQKAIDVAVTDAVAKNNKQREEAAKKATEKQKASKSIWTELPIRGNWFWIWLALVMGVLVLTGRGYLPASIPSVVIKIAWILVGACAVLLAAVILYKVGGM